MKPRFAGLVIGCINGQQWHIWKRNLVVPQDFLVVSWWIIHRKTARKSFGGVRENLVVSWSNIPPPQENLTVSWSNIPPHRKKILWSCGQISHPTTRKSSGLVVKYPTHHKKILWSRGQISNPPQENLVVWWSNIPPHQKKILWSCCEISYFLVEKKGPWKDKEEEKIMPSTMATM